jgi:hypothetical protein
MTLNELISNLTYFADQGCGGFVLREDMEQP